MEEKVDEYKQLIYKYIFHFILFIILFMTHLIISTSLEWLNSIFSILFFYISMIQIVYIIIPIIGYFIIKINRAKLNIKICKIIGKIFLIISIIIGIFFSILIIVHTFYLKTYCLECPFNLSFSYFISTFDEYFKENQEYYEIKNKCNKRRCILYEYNNNYKYQYKYLCNYNPEEEFGQKVGEPYSRTLLNGTETKTYKQVECNLLEPIYTNINFHDEKIYQYLDICYSLADFYNCNRFEEPKKYELKKEECPNENYIFLMGILCTYIIIFDLFMSFIPWFIENKSYKKILEKIEEEEENYKKGQDKKNNINKQKKQKKKNQNNNNNNNNKQDINKQDIDKQDIDKQDINKDKQININENENENENESEQNNEQNRNNSINEQNIEKTKTKAQTGFPIYGSVKDDVKFQTKVIIVENNNKSIKKSDINYDEDEKLKVLNNKKNDDSKNNE